MFEGRPACNDASSAMLALRLLIHSSTGSPPPPPFLSSTCPSNFTIINRGMMNAATAHHVNLTSQSACCSNCASKLPGCVAWTYHPDTRDCWNTLHPVAPHGSSGGVVSGYLGPAPSPGPAPTPPPAPVVPLPIIPKPKPPLGFQPNIVFFLTDDQDEILSSRMAMPRTQKVLVEKGTLGTNFFIFTPVCCPSRAETLSGRMFHRLRINGVNGTFPGEKPPKIAFGKNGGGCIGNGNGCMCVNISLVNDDSFPMYLKAAGYQVGMFGKQLNDCVKQMPSGYDRWFANGGGEYTGSGCSFYDNESPTGSTSCAEWANKTGNYPYETSVIGNATIEWIKRPEVHAQPFMAYVGVKAPHVPSTPAPWYADYFTDVSLDRNYKTPNYNVLGAHHHWLVAQQKPLTPGQEKEIDDLFRNRWRTLLSHDDLIAEVVQTIEDLGLLEKTFFFSSSDHGYNLGQLRLAGNKLHPYDNDLKIPFIARGPGILPNSVFSHVGENLDFGPTFLDLAGVWNNGAVGDMDGQSLLGPLLGIGDVEAEPPSRLYTYHEYNSLGNYTVNQGLVDDPTSHTWRGVRFPHNKTFGRPILYAEFTDLKNWNFDFVANPDAYTFFELFDTAKDPWQVHNIYENASAQVKKALHDLVVKNFKCAKDTCFPDIVLPAEGFSFLA